MPCGIDYHNWKKLSFAKYRSSACNGVHRRMFQHIKYHLRLQMGGQVDTRHQMVISALKGMLVIIEPCQQVDYGPQTLRGGSGVTQHPRCPLNPGNLL